MRVLFAFVRGGAVLAAVGLVLLLVPAPRVSSSSVELTLEVPEGAPQVLPLELTRHVREAVLDRSTIERLANVEGNGSSDASRIEAASHFERSVEVVSVDGRLFHLLVTDGDVERASWISNELATLVVARAPALASRACTAPGCSAKARVVERAALVSVPMGEARWLGLGFGVLLALVVGLGPLAISAGKRPSEKEDDELGDAPPATDRLPARAAAAPSPAPAARPMSRTLPLDSPTERHAPERHAAAAAPPAAAPALARTELAMTAPAEHARGPEKKSEPRLDVVSPIMGYAARPGWRAEASLNPEARGTLAMEFHALSAEQCVVVAVSSVSQTDAKAKVAIELALSVSRSEDRRLLLVEADFRQPAIATLLNLDVPEAVDFSLELTKRGEGESGKALGVLLCTPTLHVLPAVASRSGDLVLTTHFEAILKMLRDYYDLVIVHAPAVSVGVYATAVADVVDGAVVVGDTIPPVFAKKSPLRLVTA